MARVSVSSRIPAPFRLQGETVTASIQRLTIDQFIEFEHKWFHYGTPEPGVSVAIEGEDQMTVAQAYEARTKAEAARRGAMSPGDRDAEDERSLARARGLAAWVQECADADYFTFVEGDIAVDGVSVITGADFLKYFGGQTTVVMQVMGLVWGMNKLPDIVGNGSASRSNSRPTSATPQTVLPGPRRGPAAKRARSGGSAATAAATTAPQPAV